jgi:hypothetical protein
MPKKDLASAIREHVSRSYVRRARQQGMNRFTIRAGDVHKEMGFRDNRIPTVCSALKTRKFLEQNHLQLVDQSGPGSGQSPTVTYTYEFKAPAKEEIAQKDPFDELRGILKDVFASLGGGEKFIQSERAAWEKPEESE